MIKMMTGLVNYSSEPGSVEIRELPVPTIGEEDVLVQVGAVGVCGSDLHQFHGTHSWNVNYPVVLGHEFGGTIVQTGARVAGFQDGDRVVSETAAVIDLNSPFARSGQYNLDPSRKGFGYGVDGAMTQFVRVPARLLHHIPNSLPFEEAALAEPCCVAYHAACINVRIRPGDSVAVIGPGPIGLLCALMAVLSGADPLVVIGTPADEKRLQQAREIGAMHTLGADGRSPAEVVRGIGDGYGVDVVIDAAGVSASLKLALELVRPKGQIAKVGWGPQPCDFSLDALVQKEIMLAGSFSHNYPMWEKVVWMLSSGQIDLGPVLGMISPLVDWKSAFDSMQSGDVVKAVLIP